MSISSSNAILNQWAPTFCVTNIVGGQTLVYDPNKKAFVNSFSAGTGGVDSLSQLTDVHLNPLTLQTGQVLTWNGPDNWINSYVNYSSLQGAPVLAPVATLGTLVSLTDVNPVGLADDYILIWDTATSKWIVGPQQSTGATNLNQLTDVQITGPVNGQIFYYNGSVSKWENVNLSVLAKSVQSITSLKDVDTGIVANGYLKWNALGTSVEYVTTIPATSITGLATVATTGEYADLLNKPTNATYSFIGLNDTTDVAVNNGYVLWNSTGTTLVYSANIPATSITGLSPSATVGTLASLTDVNITTPVVDQVLRYNGTQWINSADTVGLERVVFRYSSGASGTFAVSDAVYSQTPGITATVIDGLNCIVRFSFVGYSHPPVSIMYYGQSTAVNKFTISTVQSSPLANRYVTDAGPASNPNLINGIFAPTDTITLQLRPADTSSSGALGVRAFCVILFKF